MRPSRHSLGLHRIGLHRYRCRACGGLFWLRRGRIEAVRARRREYLEAPPGLAPPRPRTAAWPATQAALGPPAEALGGLDRPPDAPAPVADLQTLDQELARRRTQARPR